MRFFLTSREMLQDHDSGNHRYPPKVFRLVNLWPLTTIFSIRQEKGSFVLNSYPQKKYFIKNAFFIGSLCAGNVERVVRLCQLKSF